MSEREHNDDSFFAKDTDPLWHSMMMGTFSGATCVVVGHPLVRADESLLVLLPRPAIPSARRAYIRARAGHHKSAPADISERCSELS